MQYTLFEQEKNAYCIHCYRFAGHIVALLQSVPNQGPVVLGVGKVLTPPPNIVSNTRTALVYVAHAEAASLERTQTTCMLDGM